MSVQRGQVLCATLLLTVLLALSSARKTLDSSQLSKKHPLKDECSAYEVHIAIGDDQAGVRVAWRTLSATCSSVVTYGPLLQSSNATRDKSNALQGLAHAFSLTEGEMCTAPATKQKFVINMHEAYLRNLAPDTKYWYQIGGDGVEYEFTSPPRVGSTRPFSFLAYGDMGESTYNTKHCAMSAQTLTAIDNEVQRSPIDLVVHAGDLAYADGHAKKWDSFMQAIQPIASRVPYMVGVGNHEYDFIGSADMDPSGVTEPYRPAWGNFGDDSGGECGAMTARRFIMPNVRAATDNAPFWYSFDYASAHFTYLSTEHDLSPGSVQYNWLARDLAAVDRCVTPWIVVVLHRPMYVVYPHKANKIVGDHIRDFIEDLLIEYQVDLTLAGHVHTYYRTCDVRNEKCEEDGSGIYHFVVGTAGHVLSETTEEQRDWLDAHVGDYGFMRFDVEGDSMWARFILSQTGEVADEVRLVTRLYTPDACNTLRADSAARAQALETRLATLKEQHARGETDPGAHIQDLTSHIEMTGAQDTLLQRS